MPTVIDVLVVSFRGPRQTVLRAKGGHWIEGASHVNGIRLGRA